MNEKKFEKKKKNGRFISYNQILQSIYLIKNTLALIFLFEFN